jgi:hypothetical protein
MTYRELLIKLSKLSSKELDMPVLAWGSNYMLSEMQAIMKNSNEDCRCNACRILANGDLDAGHIILNFNDREECHVE